MSDALSSFAADGDAVKVYRLKENPTWVRFGPRGGTALAPQPHARSDVSADTCLSCEVTGRQQAGTDSHNSSSGGSGSSAQVASTASTMPSLRVSSRVDARELVEAASQAAIRAEHLQGKRQASWSGSQASTSDVHHVSSPSLSSSLGDGGSSESRRRPSCYAASSASLPSRCGAHPPLPSQGTSRAASLCDRTNATASRSSATSSVYMHATSPLCSTHRTTAAPEPPQPTAASLPRRSASPRSPSLSVSRAAATHLSGSAAVVEVEGPLDSLYVPLRRPPPPGCEATRQHFSIFHGAEGASGSSSHRPGCGRRGGEAAAVVRAPASELGSGGGGQMVSSSWSVSGDPYQTSNSFYGRGC